MSMEYIWTVSAAGVPCRIPVIQDPKCTSEVDWQEVPCSDGSSIRTIVASSTTSFAIDRSGRVLVLVLPTHIAIREKVEIYANQRWLLLGWAPTLFIDRPRFSDETGRVSKEPSSDEVAAGWSWEEPWTAHLDPLRFDADGWQYSYLFLAGKWEKKCGRFHQVRRRILKRHMRYTAHDQWVEMSNEDEIMFTELAMGVAEKEILLFALGTDGNVYRRLGITTNLPGGSNWEKMPKIHLKGYDVDDVTLISASPSFSTLICITWDGKMFHRRGISRQNLCGVIWENIPTPKEKAVICASIGTHTLWCITADGSVWYTRVQVDEKRKEHLMESITANGYQLVTKGGICRLSVTKNDQVFCISTREKIEMRTGISKDEESGKRFERLVDRGDPEDQKWISIHAGAVYRPQIPEYFLSSTSLKSRMEVLEFKKSDWRKTILERLQNASDRSWAVMNGVKGVETMPEDIKENTHQDNVKVIKCQLKNGDAFRSVSVAITESNLEISGDAKTQKSIEKTEIKSVLPSFQLLPHKYLLYVFHGTESESNCFAFTEEKACNSFQSTIESIIREHILSSTRTSFGESMWSVSSEGVVRWHCFAEMSKETGYEKKVNPGATRGLTVEGHFKSIDCGAKRAVWAITESGSLYSLSTRFDPLNSHEAFQFENKMTDEVTFRMHEYQKHAIFRGFITFQGTQKGVSAWMSDGKPCPPEFSSLPSKHWSWINSAWKLDDETWSYSNEIDGVYTVSEKEQGKVRRRTWQRLARFESKKSPWCHVEAPEIQCVRVSKTESLDGHVTIVVLTKDGHILQRSGVNRNNSAGDSWTQILADFPISCIHLQSKEELLWCITTDGSVMSKSLISNGGWSHLDLNLTPLTRYFTSANSFNMTGCSGILYFRLNSILYRVDTNYGTISDPYPMDNLQEAVVNAHGFICLRGVNVTVVREWRVVPYTDKKATIIAMQKVERATNLGRRIKSVSFY